MMLRYWIVFSLMGLAFVVYAVQPVQTDSATPDSLKHYNLDTLRVTAPAPHEQYISHPFKAISMAPPTRRYTLDTVRIIGEIPAETIGSISVKKIDTAAQAAPLNLKDSMQNLGGISVTVGTKDESNLRIRGFRKNEVKILVDGRPLNAGYFGGVDLQNMPVSDLKEIRILKGPVSSIYGSNTMGGVVNLVSGQPSTRKWLKLGAQFQRNNTNHLEFSTSHSFDSWNYWLYGARDNTEGFVLPQDFEPTINENGDVRNNLQKTQYNFQMRNEFTLFDWHTIGSTAGYTFIEKKLIPRPIYGLGEEYRMYRDWARYQATLLDNYILDESRELKTILYLDGGQDTYQTYRDAAYQDMDLTSTMKYLTLGFNPRLQWQLSPVAKLQTGLRSELLHSNRKDNGNYTEWTSHDLGLSNLFAQLEYAVNPKLNVTGGMGTSFFKTDMRKKISAFAEPSLGFYYSFQSGATASVACGFNTAYPTMRQLFSSDKGNPDLKPQYSGKYEISANQPLVMHSIPGSIGGSIYYNDIHNLIDVYGGKYTNLNRVKSYGSEVNLAIQPLRWWETEIAYAWLEFDRKSDYNLTESPVNSVELYSAFKPLRNVSFSVTSTYKDNRLSLDNGFTYHTLPAYWTHSMSLVVSWKNYRLNFGLENFTDTYYEEEYGYPASGIDFRLGLGAEI